MVLALTEFLELTLAIALAIVPVGDARNTGVVLGEPLMAMREALRPEHVGRVLDRLPVGGMRCVILREVLEERGAVRKAHHQLP